MTGTAGRARRRETSLEVLREVRGERSADRPRTVVGTSRLLSWSTGQFPGVAPMVGGARWEQQANIPQAASSGSPILRTSSSDWSPLRLGLGPGRGCAARGQVVVLVR